jgi:hypothetical protein
VKKRVNNSLSLAVGFKTGIMLPDDVTLVQCRNMSEIRILYLSIINSVRLVGETNRVPCYVKTSVMQTGPDPYSLDFQSDCSLPPYL